MKKILLLAVLIFTASVGSVAQNWDWMKPMGFNYSDFGTTELYRGPTGKMLIRCNSAYGLPDGSDIILTNSNGDPLWRKTFPGIVLEDICFDAEENIYFCGSFKGTIALDGSPVASNGSSDAIVVKLNSSGDYLDHISFGASTADAANSLIVNNGNVFVTGFFRGSFSLHGFPFNAIGEKRLFLMKFKGDFELLKTFQSDSSGYASGLKVNFDANNNLFLMGSADSFVTMGGTTVHIDDSGQLLAKFSNELDCLWTKVIVGHFMYGYYYPYLLFDNSNNLVMLHKTGGGGGAMHNLRIWRYDQNGLELNSQLIPENCNGYMDLDTAGNALVAGHYSAWAPPLYFTLTSTSGTPTCDTLVYDATTSDQIIVNGFSYSSENDFCLLVKSHAGAHFGSFGFSSEGDAFLIHYGNNVTTTTQDLASSGELNVYPNPTQGVLTVELKYEDIDKGRSVCVYDLLGKCVLSGEMESGEIQLDLTKMDKGVYFLYIETYDPSTANLTRRERRISKKLVLN